MLIVNRATMTASAIVDDAKIAEFGAILDVMNNDPSFYSKQFDKEACKEHREEVRSPSLEAQGYYWCEKCCHHDDRICVICEEGRTVVCNILQKHVSRWHTCKYFEPMNSRK